MTRNAVPDVLPKIDVNLDYYYQLQKKNTYMVMQFVGVVNKI